MYRVAFLDQSLQVLLPPPFLGSYPFVTFQYSFHAGYAQDFGADDLFSPTVIDVVLVRRFLSTPDFSFLSPWSVSIISPQFL